MRILLILAFLLLPGCSLIPPAAPATTWSGPALGANPVEEALRYYGYVKKLSGADLARELDAVKGAYDRSRDDFTRIQYVMLLSLPKASFHDAGRALKLLDGWTREEGPGLRRFGVFLAAQLAEQKRLEDSADGLRAKLKEEQRRADEAQSKLDALKSIERSMLRRRTNP